MRKLYTLVSFITLTTATAQVGGRDAYQFLQMPTSPKQAALGGSNVTITGNEVNQVLYNPASLNAEMNNMLAANFGSYYGDISLGAAAYAHQLKNGRNVHVGVTYLGYGSIDGYDENGVSTGSFSGSDVAVSVGYAHPFSNTNFSVGANLKAISSTLESYNSFAVAADIGGLYNDKDSGWTVGLTFKNLGGQLSSYEDTRESLPFEAVVGVSKLLENVPIRWHFTLENLQQWDVSFSNPNRSQVDLENNVTQEEVSFGNNLLRHVVFGVELFPEKNFNVRLGYNFRNGEEMRILEQRHFAGFTAGFGLQVKRFRFEYAYNRFTLAGNTNLFGLSIKL
ncbi:type IX secretion system protein PorQ [Flavobacterium sp. CBA20B-1]|uniref:type IX secretion system protein PorQ n=1 Tax=unclassified Flavobacterium TaxID=196869 RepID=UPI0022247A81|nr:MULTISPECIES: type IX secretion system protein PorQ [unclassified Flavobacterium]WCM43032.1 type IX secretion system protein PorQ [Flavobacterium sp. CBA20B-1]